MKRLLILTVLIFVGLSAPAYAEKCSVGVIPQFPHPKLFSIWRPILKELEKTTDCEFVWKHSKNIADFQKDLFEGDFDFSYANPEQVVLAHKLQGYQPLLRSSAKKLQGILVVAEGSEIKTVKDLHGKKIAFPSPNAFAASKLIQLDLKNKFNIDFEAFYNGTHSKTYADVVAGRASAGGGANKTLSEQSGLMRKRLRVLYETDSYPSHAFMARSDLKPGLLEQVQDAMLVLYEEQPELFFQIPMDAPVSTTIDDYSIESLILLSAQPIDQD